MFIPREAESQAQQGQGRPRRQGCRRRQGRLSVSLAELRSQLDRPSTMDDLHRQRLLELAHRLAAVQALGDEYGRVQLSDAAAAAVAETAAAV